MKKTLIIVLIILGIVGIGIQVKHEIEREIMKQKVLQEYEQAKRIITEELENASKKIMR